MGKTADLNRNQPFLVRVTGFEPAASCSQSRRATICATPGYLVFIRLGGLLQSSHVITAAAPRLFLRPCASCAVAGSPISIMDCRGKVNLRLPLHPRAKSKIPRPPAALGYLAALCFNLIPSSFFKKKPDGFYKYHAEQ